ncbi:LysM domain/BON superfamily protein [compost metagenome]
MIWVIQQAHACFTQRQGQKTLVVQAFEVGHPQIQTVTGQLLKNLLGAQRAEFEVQVRVVLVQALQQGQRIEARQRHHAQAQVTDQVAATGGSFSMQAIVSRNHRTCPGQHPLALGGEAFEALATVDQGQVQLLLQVAQAHGQGRLGYMAAGGGLAEVAGFIQGDEEFELFDVHRRSLAQSRRSILTCPRLQAPRFITKESGMSIFSFIKEAGEKIIDLLTPGNANASEQLQKHVEAVGLGNPNIKASVEGDKVTVTGEVASQEEKEKILLALGNIAGVAEVDDQITVTGPVMAAARFVVVKKGDTLSAISLAVYGNANLYNKIFEANKPMLKHPDKIYPGQSLRIPE